MKVLSLVFLFLIFSFSSNPHLFSDEFTQNGSLILTYQTDSKGERLDRIRFWIKDKNHKQTLNPKGKACVVDPKEQSKMVVIEDLTPGRYEVDFLIPYTDEYFEEIPCREVMISKGEIVKIDQKIRPQKSNTHSERIHKQKSSKEEALPKFLPLEKNKSLPLAENSSSEKLDQSKIEAEKNSIYKDTASDKKEYSAPPPGKLIVSYKTRSDPSLLERIRFKLIDAHESFTVHPRPKKDMEVYLKTGHLVMVQDIPAGAYSLEFFIEGAPEKSLFTSGEFQISESKTLSLFFVLSDEPLPSNTEHKTSVEEASALTVSTNIPTAVFQLKSENDARQWEGRGRLHTFEKILPGLYTLSFESTDPIFTPPEAMRIEIFTGKENLIEANFQTPGKLKVLADVEGSPGFQGPKEPIGGSTEPAELTIEDINATEPTELTIEYINATEPTGARGTICQQEDSIDQTTFEKVDYGFIDQRMQQTEIDFMGYGFYSWGESVGICDSYGAAGVLLSSHLCSPCNFIIVDARYHFFDKDRFGTSTGIGYRFIHGNECHFDGLFLYYDFFKGCVGNFHQIGLSYEKIKNCFEFRLNAYFPLHTKGKSKLDTIFNDYDNTGILVPYEVKAFCKEYPFTGFDVETGCHYRRGCFDSYAGIGLYYFTKSSCMNPLGVKGIVRVFCGNYFTIEGQVTWDKCNRVLSRGQLEFRIPFELICNPCGTKVCSSRPIKRVYRDGPIHLDRCCEYETNY